LIVGRWKRRIITSQLHAMNRALRELDRVLRGDATQIAALRDGSPDVSARRLLLILIVLGGLYGVCMGSFAVFRHNEPDYEYHLQLLATAIKVPALFLLTLVVTFPSLYVFNALVGSRLTVLPVLRLLVASLCVNLAVLASLGPIVAFFGASTTSYSFMVLLNVVAFATAGLLGLLFLLQTLHRLTVARDAIQTALGPTSDEIVEAEIAEGSSADAPLQTSLSPPARAGALDRIEGHVLGRHVKKVFYCWVVMFGFVGAQMGWVMRPFIGSPNTPFTWFRERHGNFFEALAETIVNLLSGR
jgi:hypothetical protein